MTHIIYYTCRWGLDQCDIAHKSARTAWKHCHQLNRVIGGIRYWPKVHEAFTLDSDEIVRYRYRDLTEEEYGKASGMIT